MESTLSGGRGCVGVRCDMGVGMLDAEQVIVAVMCRLGAVLAFEPHGNGIRSATHHDMRVCDLAQPPSPMEATLGIPSGPHHPCVLLAKVTAS